MPHPPLSDSLIEVLAKNSPSVPVTNTLPALATILISLSMMEEGGRPFSLAIS